MLINTTKTFKTHRSHQDHRGHLARRAKPMHAHTKPVAQRSAATNDTALTNDHKIDRGMPARATHTHTPPPHAAPPACQAITSVPQKPLSSAQPHTRR